MIDKSEWQWFGAPGHFVCAHDCRFHLCTLVGRYLVSTVGQYLPDVPVREILARSRGIILEGRGEERRADYMAKVGFEEIGADRKYETYVFHAGDVRCAEPDCQCGMPRPTDLREVEGVGANQPGEAQRNHMEMCEKYAAMQ
jgi:hypothetical protein